MERLKCKCGNEEAFYTKESFKGNCNCYYNANGEMICDSWGKFDNSGMYDSAESKHTSRFIYCAECDKKVGKIEDFEAWKD